MGVAMNPIIRFAHMYLANPTLHMLLGHKQPQNITAPTINQTVLKIPKTVVMIVQAVRQLGLSIERHESTARMSRMVRNPMQVYASTCSHTLRLKAMSKPRIWLYVQGSFAKKQQRLQATKGAWKKASPRAMKKMTLPNARSWNMVPYMLSKLKSSCPNGKIRCGSDESFSAVAYHWWLLSYAQSGRRQVSHR